MTSTEPIQVALIGCGRWGSLILRDLVQLGVSVTVVTPNLANKSDIAERGAIRVVDSLSNVGHVDGIVVASPTSTHATVVREALSIDVPIFCEKPLTDDLGAAEALRIAGGDRIFVMDKWRYHLGVEALRDVVKSGSIGHLRSIVTHREQWGSPHSDVDASWILLPHDLAIAIEIRGSVPTPIHSRATEIDGHLKELTTHWRWDDGCTLTTTIGIIRETPLRRIVACGDSRMAVLEDGWSNQIEIRDYDDADSSKVQRIDTAGPLPLLRELDAFVAYLRGGQAPKSGIEDAVSVVKGIHLARTMAGLSR